jgi:carbon storage regulator
MLVITRKKNDAILIGDDIEITIVKIEDGSVKLAITAPKDVTILRKELYKDVAEENQKSILIDRSVLKKMK